MKHVSIIKKSPLSLTPKAHTQGPFPKLISKAYFHGSLPRLIPEAHMLPVSVLYNRDNFINEACFCDKNYALRLTPRAHT